MTVLKVKYEPGLTHFKKHPFVEKDLRRVTIMTRSEEMPVNHFD
jgi:hypothetical protein